MKYKWSLFLIILNVLTMHLSAAGFYIPVIEEPWWQVASNPDLGEYTGPKQEPVDFGLWQAEDGSWQLWSCIRSVKLDGHNRLFHGWEGAKLTDKNWTPKGIMMMAKPELGEPLGGLQAPHVIKYQGQYWMAYGDWDNMRLAVSKDGKNFERFISAGVIFSEGAKVNNRDPMMLFTRGKWHCYYTAFPAGHGYVYCRTSDDLLSWSDPVIVAYGGMAGNNPYSCECPHVIEVTPGNYFLFRTQLYGPGAQTTVYQSENPYHFGIDNDAYYVRQFNLCAPEIVMLDGKYYIAALNPNLDGVRVTRLKWKHFENAVFDFDNEKHRKQWRVKTQENRGQLPVSGDKSVKVITVPGFTNSIRQGVFSKTDYFISSGNDNQTAIIESPVFTVNAPECVIYVSGGKDTQNLYVSIQEAGNGAEYVHITGNGRELFDPVIIDCTAFMNKQVILKIADKSTVSMGHINFGGIYQIAGEK